MVTTFFFKDRNGQTPLPREMQKALKIKNIQCMAELDEHEEENIAEGLLWLEKAREDPLSYDFWLKLHRKLFGDIWTWAGKIRTHELENPDFIVPHQIRPALKQLQDDVRYWILHNTYSQAEISARFHERIETIHPFTNGNGRFGRILIQYFCRQHKATRPTWGSQFAENPKFRRSAYIEALTKARREKSYEALTQFMFT